MVLLKQYQHVKVIDSSIDYDQYVSLDLSISNENAGLFSDTKSLENYIANYLSSHNAQVAYGGYNEHRNLYKRSEIFEGGEDQRDIHIGIDLWANSGTSILAALEGKVHSFNYNTGIGNYGPTIILEHKAEQQVFYTLYGHLSLKSIEDLEIGESFKKGQVLGTLGNAQVNGDYPPHLHFQIIFGLEGNSGDYPGVCSSKNLDSYLANCPDPNLLLKIQP